MAWLDAGLQAIFGAALGALYGDGVLHRVTSTDDGFGGFTPTALDSPVKLLVDSLSDADRAAGGLPRPAVRITVLRAGLPGPIDIDDRITTEGASYRVLQAETDPAGASFTLVAVPVSS